MKRLRTRIDILRMSYDCWHKLINVIIIENNSNKFYPSGIGLSIETVFQWKEEVFVYDLSSAYANHPKLDIEKIDQVYRIVMALNTKTYPPLEPLNEILKDTIWCERKRRTGQLNLQLQLCQISRYKFTFDHHIGSLLPKYKVDLALFG